MEWSKLVPELIVTRYERSRRFYIDVFGFELKFERPENRFGYFDLQGAQLMLLESTTAQIGAPDRPGPIGRGIHFQVEIEALAPLLARLEAHGVVPKSPVVESWYRADEVEHGQHEFFVTDPDGYLFRFAEYIGERPVGISAGTVSCGDST